MPKNNTKNQPVNGGPSGLQLSKSEQQKVTSWAQNIAQKLKTPQTCLITIPAALESYKVEDPNRTQFLRSVALSIEKCDEIGCTVTQIIILQILRMDKTKPEDQPMYQLYINLLKILMKYGAKPSQGIGFPAIFQLYSNFGARKDAKDNRFNHKELIEIMAEDPAIFDIVDDEDISLINNAALRGDKDSVEYILSKRPDLLNKKNSLGLNMLTFMFIHEQDDLSAYIMIKYKPELHHTFAPGLTTLQSAIQKNQIKSVNMILLQEGSIASHIPSLIPDNPILRNTLETSGFFLDKVNCLSINCDKPYFKIQAKNEQLIITSVEDIEKLTIKPTANQIKRLHISFNNTIPTWKRNAAEYSAMCKLYAAFCQKFPSEHDMSQHKQVSSVNIHDYYRNPGIFETLFQDLLPHLTENDHSDELAAGWLAQMHSYLSKDNIAFHANITLFNSLHKYNDSLTTIFNPECELSVKFHAYMISYYITTKLIKPLIPRCNGQEIIELISASVVTFISCFKIVEHQMKPSDDLIEVISMMINTARSHHGDLPHIRTLEMILNYPVIFRNIQLGFYSEIEESLTKIKILINQSKSPVSYPVGVLLLITGLIETNAQTFSCSLSTKLRIMKLCISVIDQSGALANLECHIQGKQAYDYFINQKTTIERELISRLATSIPTSDDLRTYVIDEKNKRLSITFKQDCDAKKLQSFIKNLTVATQQSKAIVINLFEHDLDEVIESITQIKSLTLTEIQHDARPQPEPHDTQVTATNVTPQVPYYLPEPAKASSKPLPPAKPMPSVNQPAASASASSAPAMPAEDVIEPIKTEIRSKLGIAQGIMLYSLYNKPDIHDNRRHLFWGIWFATLIEENATFITADERNRFQTLLAEGGTFASSALNKHGLRPVMVQDTVTQKQVPSYKLKLASKGSRIFAAPIQVKLKTGEIAQVYCFGFPVKHKEQEQKQNTVTVDPRKLGIKL